MGRKGIKWERVKGKEGRDGGRQRIEGNNEEMGKDRFYQMKP